MTDYATHISEAYVAARNKAYPRLEVQVRDAYLAAFMAGTEAALSWQRRERGPCPYGFDDEAAWCDEALADKTVAAGLVDKRIAAARELVRRLEAEQREGVRDG